MTDHLHNLIIGVLNEGFERDRLEADKVRDEIKRRGTYWAGTEILELRRAVASLRKQLTSALSSQKEK
jgi:hypothetical protein